ncbi:MAG: aminoacyl-histidine dipeptidase [Clostridiaceae bacterium]|jgi:dipeptidase D|nr:aminoacyl-histidine dipeptidase [Clostridiaceae bacterium]
MKNKVLDHVEPKDVYKYFEELTQIPRGSGNEKKVSDYLVSFAKEHNLQVIQDKALNVIIKKKATEGYENKPSIIIQGHMDMVCEKEENVEHDFLNDPLKLKVVDDMVYASGTTLGSDNGIALAMGMAILAANDIPHPAIEMLATTSEETGMDGAMSLDPKDLDGSILINIDSEEEGKLLVSCAGGMTVRAKIKAQWEKPSNNLIPFALRIRGLKGGHSGMEIDKGRANANKLMGRILNDLTNNFNLSICSINGGSKHNAIPRENEVIMLISQEDKHNILNKITEFEKIFKTEYRSSDSDIEIHFHQLQLMPKKTLSSAAQKALVDYLYLVPNGIMTMSMEIKGLVESSLNIGVVLTSDDTIEFVSAIRSSVRSLKNEIYNRIAVLAKIIGIGISTESNYPEWSYNPNSRIRETFIEVYERLYHKKPEITAIHAGVECGLFGEKFGQLDMISFGPNLYDVHTPNEHMSISSVRRTWEYLIEVLKDIQ